MRKLMLRAGLLLVSLGVAGLANAAGYPTSGVVIGAAQLADQSILVLPFPSLPTVNSTLVSLGQQKISQPAIYVAPGASKAVAISLDCAAVQLNIPDAYFSWQEFVASGKGSDGQMYGIHMTSFQVIRSGPFGGTVGWPLSYLILSPAMRAKLPTDLVNAVGLVDLQLTTVYGGKLANLYSSQIGYSTSVNVTVTNKVATTRAATNDCGVLEGGHGADPWVQSGLFALVGNTSLPVNLPINLP